MFWNRVYQSISPVLEGKNKDLFFTDLGLGLHSILLEHFKKFTINAAGGIILTKDIALYYSTIENWKIPALNEPFELLRELGNVFIVKYHVFRATLTLGLIFFDRCFARECWRESNLPCSVLISDNVRTIIQVTCIDWYVIPSNKFLIEVGRKSSSKCQD